MPSRGFPEASGSHQGPGRQTQAARDPAHRPLRRRLDALDDEGDALAAADAHGGQTVAALHPNQFVN